MSTMKKIIVIVAVALVLATVLFLTFQGVAETTKLSQDFRLWIKQFGYKGSHHQIRSDIHYAEYFVVGLAMAILSVTLHWKFWCGALIAAAFGLTDETIKIFLPVRSFSGVDLIKDFIGITLATVIVFLVTRKKRLMRTNGTIENKGFQNP